MILSTTSVVRVCSWNAWTMNLVSLVSRLCVRIIVNSLRFVLIPDCIMKYVKISLIDGNTGEVIYDTNATAVDTSSYLRSKISKNVDSFCNYFRDHPGRDLVFQVSVREQRKSLVLFDDVY